MRRFIFISLLFMTSILLAACGGASTPTAGDDGASSQQVNIAVSTNPNPPMMADIELILIITNGSGNLI